MTDLVATIVSNPSRPALTDALLARLAQVLPLAGVPVRLDDGLVAADLRLAQGPDAAIALEALRTACSDAPVDVIVQPAATRRKALFLADMDSTMIGQECIDELADFVGLKDKVSAITERAMRGELAFEPALRERVWGLAVQWQRQGRARVQAWGQRREQGLRSTSEGVGDVVQRLARFTALNWMWLLGGAAVLLSAPLLS
ncbi:MAG: hypothetical protein ACOYOJ_22175, partial [Alsobacter sp.]